MTDKTTFDQELQKKKLSIYKSLAAFQQECTVIHKGTSGYGYTYAGLPEIFKVINPLLEKHGLGFTQLINGLTIDTILFHVETGELLTSKTDIPQDVKLAKMNDFQVLGSAVTYIRRYALSSMLGIITDKDTDAGGKQEQPSAKEKKPVMAEILFIKYVKALMEDNTTLSIEDAKKKYTFTPEQITELDTLNNK